MDYGQESYAIKWRRWRGAMGGGVEGGKGFRSFCLACRLSKFGRGLAWVGGRGTRVGFSCFWWITE